MLTNMMLRHHSTMSAFAVIVILTKGGSPRRPIVPDLGPGA